MASQIARQDARGIRIVRDIQNPSRLGPAGAMTLKAAGQAHLREPARDRRGRQAQARRDFLQSRDRRRGIGELNVAQERRRGQLRQIPAGAAIAPACAVQDVVVFDREALQRRAHAARDLLEHQRRLAAADHGGSAGTEYPRFLARDGLERVAQVLLVIETDAGDHGDIADRPH